jgi:hypothetical protein
MEAVLSLYLIQLTPNESMESSFSQTNPPESNFDNLFWLNINTSQIRQGDYLPNCLVPMLITPMDELFEQSDQLEYDIQMEERDLIVITQSCDLENKKSRIVALCPIYSISDYERLNTDYAKRGKWEEVRKGKIEGLHMLSSPHDPTNNRNALVVDFREIHSLPIDVVLRHTAKMDDRWRLQSPYLEHFSQSFARVFMRVALPSSIPPFK